MSSPKAKAAAAKASSPKKTKAKKAKGSAAKIAAEGAILQEPTRDEKAAFVKAMLRGIEPGTKAAEVMADKKAGRKSSVSKSLSAGKEATSSKVKKSGKTGASKANGKVPKLANSKVSVEPVLDAEPRVEILRKISAPEPVVSTPRSKEILKLAKEIEAALEKGDMEHLQPHAVQALMMALCKFYAANDENDIVYPILPGRLAISGTDAMVVCGALLRAVDLQVFELGMFQSWSGR